MKRVLLSARRKIVGLSQEALAEQLGIDVSTVRRWEYGDRCPQPWQRPHLAAALKVTLEDLNVLLTADGAHNNPSDEIRPVGHLVNPPASSHIGNPALDALIRGAGFASPQQFAKAVNKRAHRRRKLCTTFDQSTVQRWLAGSRISNPGVVADVLSDAWGVPIPVEVIWPELRNGKPMTPAQLQPWVAARTLEALGIFVRTDMLTRRETLTQAVKAVTGPALTAPIAGWLATLPGRLEARDHGTQRIGLSDVEAIERSTRYFAATDAQIGGVLSREAAVGQLKYAVDLASHASYSEAVGNRLLAAIAELSGLVGWLSHDSGMSGPAQQYFLYGLQAARESADPRAKLFVVSILADMGQQMHWLGHYDAALKLYDLALRQLPSNRSRFRVLRAVLTAKRVEDGLAYLGSSHLREVKTALGQSFDLYAQGSDDEAPMLSRLWHRDLDMSESVLSIAAASAYFTMAQGDPSLAAEAENYTVSQLVNMPEGQGRNKLFGQIRLARLRLLADEPEQACEEGEQALRMAETVSSSMIQAKLRDLLADSEPYATVPRVVEFRDRLRGALAGLN